MWKGRGIKLATKYRPDAYFITVHRRDYSPITHKDNKKKKGN